ncbi:STAS domain-containing protein [Actinoplanes couchii]|uniref:Anti-anti-sigma factor n=1 Tax=Actinoplanes couchii TaxID=403638 RepID=A0ABQ3XNQ9_9ACTN|nr:STAS domain-containing protein [Actinoplanes couchii]MDR6319630.1 anti-anti-sigma factor [Actinoplanes couchii]GID60147.1 anti-anti-sigma factor [Actinoplanes couchii]
MSTPLDLTAGPASLTAVGEIDMSNAGTFRAALDAALTPDGTAILTVDLTGVEYIDSSGLSCLFEHVERIRLVAGPLVAPVLTVSGLADITRFV